MARAAAINIYAALYRHWFFLLCLKLATSQIIGNNRYDLSICSILKKPVNKTFFNILGISEKIIYNS